jgi:cell division septation protein DedD
VLLVALVLVSTASFGLGVVAGRDSGAGEGAGGEEIRIEKPPETVIPEPPSPATTTAPKKNPGTGSETTYEDASKPSPSAASGGEYVASKTGTKYYLPWCGTAKRIKEENKVWFSSKAEAEAAGYEPAKNCKGL